MHAVPRVIHRQVSRASASLGSFVLDSHLCRANIGNAKVLGLYKDLHLTDNQYNLALSIFFAGYVLFETPSNIIIKRISPRWYIPVMTVRDLVHLLFHARIPMTTHPQVIWGIVCSLFSLVHSSAGLAVARFFLGFAEAGFLPGIVFWSTQAPFSFARPGH